MPLTQMRSRICGSVTAAAGIYVQISDLGMELGLLGRAGRAFSVAFLGPREQLLYGREVERVIELDADAIAVGPSHDPGHAPVGGGADEDRLLDLELRARHDQTAAFGRNVGKHSVADLPARRPAAGL